MFKRFGKLIKPKRRLRRAIESCGLRGRVERLEDRAMLSANIGPAMHGGAYDIGPQNLNFQQHESGAVATSVQTSSEYGPWLRSDRESSSASLGSFDAPRIGGGQGRINSISQAGSWVPVGGVYALQPNGWKLIGLEYAWQPWQNPLRATQSSSNTTPSGEFNYGTAKNPAPGGRPLAATSPVFDPPQFSNGGGNNQGPFANSSGASAGPGGNLNLGSLSLSTSAMSIPTAAQILSRPANSIAFMTSGAVDSAFQSYATQLLLLSTSTNVSDQITSLNGDDVLHADDDASDYVTLTSDSLADGAINGDDAVDRERQAVDAVLSELHDFSKLPTKQWNNLPAMDRTADAIGMIEMNVNDVWSAALADAEGGMVMLANTGDANESAFDLASVAESGGDLLHVHAGVEAAVGLYQTMDVGTDEVPVVNLPNVRSAAEPSREVGGENRYSNESEKASSNKAAATIGATLVGALLFANRSARAKDKRDDELAD